MICNIPKVGGTEGATAAPPYIEKFFKSSIPKETKFLILIEIIWNKKIKHKEEKFNIAKLMKI